MNNISTPKTKGRLIYSQDLQLQTFHSDGRCTIDDIIQGSISHGRTTIGITDHAIGWDDGDEHARFFETAESFESYLSDITNAKKHYRAKGVTILAGLEVEIGLDGQMALAKGITDVIGSASNLLKCIDYVIGVIHSESFSVSLEELSQLVAENEKPALLLKNIEALISNPDVLIWGHPFQAGHGHFLRNFTKVERRSIIGYLKKRTEPLLLEYNLNPTPRYYEWQGKSTHYENGSLLPNDMEFFEECIEQLNSSFVLSTDAHDVAQTNRLNRKTKVPIGIKNRIAYLNEVGKI